MSDDWTNQKDKTLLNFLVKRPKGTMFIKYVDASPRVKDTTLLCELWDGFILEIGLHKVVKVITGNATNYVVVGRLLTLRYLSLFWTPCAIHCINLILEYMGKISYIQDITESTWSVTKFIYNHAFMLSLMR
jgi:hypothetical protein